MISNIEYLRLGEQLTISQLEVSCSWENRVQNHLEHPMRLIIPCRNSLSTYIYENKFFHKYRRNQRKNNTNPKQSQHMDK
jgi:hypothetical protein